MESEINSNSNSHVDCTARWKFGRAAHRSHSHSAGHWTLTHNILARVSRSQTHMMRTVAGLLPRRPMFDPRAGHMGFVADVMTLQEVCHPVMLLSPVSVSPPCFPKCAPTSSRGCLDTFLYFLFESYLFFNYRNNILLTIIAELLYLVMCLFHVTVRISN